MVRSLECRRQRWANGWMDRGNILFLLCGLSYCSRWGRVSFMIQGPQSLDGWEQDMAIVTSPALVSQRTSNQTCMRRWQGWASNFSLHSPFLHSVSLSCLWKKKKHLEDCISPMLGELKVEVMLLKNKKISWSFVCITSFKQICVNNTISDRQCGNTAYSFQTRITLWRTWLAAYKKWIIPFLKCLFIQQRVLLSVR